MYDWLSYGACMFTLSNYIRAKLTRSLFVAQKNYFYHREIAFTYKDDIYSRFNCFSDCESFRKSVISNCPRKIDYGAVYNAPVRIFIHLHFFSAIINVYLYLLYYITAQKQTKYNCIPSTRERTRV